MKIGNFEVGYLSDFTREYQAMLDAALSLESLRAGLTLFDPFVWMDSRAVKSWSENDFDDFKKFLKHERRIAKSGAKETASRSDMERFSPIIMPMPLFDITLLAEQFKAPFGLALIRGIEAKRYSVQDDRIVILKQGDKRA